MGSPAFLQIRDTVDDTEFGLSGVPFVLAKTGPVARAELRGRRRGAAKVMIWGCFGGSDVRLEAD